VAFIYIDTNVYLDFYQSTTDRLTVFKEIDKYSSKVVITRQTADEFLRNRVSRLADISKQVDKSSSSGIYTTAIVLAMEQFKEIDEHQKSIKKLASEISRTLDSWKDDANADPVLIEFYKIFKKSKFLEHSPEAVTRATQRKLIGNPPTSPDKYTIGDELIWETLLEGAKDDLIIVSRDHTFVVNQSLLKLEFKEKTGFELRCVTKSISEALKLIGEISPQLAKAEQEVAASAEIDARQLGKLCPRCGGELEEAGYDGSDGDSAWWLDCTKCSATYFPSRQ